MMNTDFWILHHEYFLIRDQSLVIPKGLIGSNEVVSDQVHGHGFEARERSGQNSPLGSGRQDFLRRARAWGGGHLLAGLEQSNLSRIEFCENRGKRFFRRPPRNRPHFQVRSMKPDSPS